MATGVSIGADGKAREVKDSFFGVDGIARRVIEGYIGVDGKARLFYVAEPYTPTAEWYFSGDVQAGEV